MALSIPIVSEFDGKGIDKAIKEFKQLETVGEKAQFAIKKAAIPAAAAITAVAGALGLAAKAAAEDEQQQAILANTMQNVVGATDATVAATEDMIAAMSRATGTADSELRPAFSALLVGTKNVGDATTALSLAQDISVATGTDLVTVSDALAKAYAGNMKGLQALSPEMKGLIKDGASLDVVMMALADNFGGAAAASAKTAAGQFKILKNSLDETTESIGAALLPVVQAVLPFLQRFADWAQKNPQAFLYIAGTIAAISTAILALNFAMSLNPVVALTAGIIALSAAMVYLEQKTDALSNSWGRFGAVIRLVLGPLYDVFALAGKLGLIDKINIPSLPSTSYPAPTSNLPPALRFAPQPIITPTMPTVPAIIGGGGSGGGGSRVGGGGGGGGTGAGAGDLVTIQGALTTSGNAERIAARSSGGVTINVTGGMSTSAEIGQSVLNSLLAYQRTNGPLDLQIAS
jgi:hypothetical protein